MAIPLDGNSTTIRSESAEHSRVMNRFKDALIAMRTRLRLWGGYAPSAGAVASRKRKLARWQRHRVVPTSRIAPRSPDSAKKGFPTRHGARRISQQAFMDQLIPLNSISSQDRDFEFRDPFI